MTALDTSTLKTFNRLYPQFIKKYETLVSGADDTISDKINSIIDSLNDVGQLTNDVVKNWNTVMQWVLNDGLTDKVTTKIDDMYTNGDFNTLIEGSVFTDFSTRLTANESSLDHITKQIFIVSSYGAVGDKTADDTIAIQNAVNAASNAGGGVVVLTGLHKTTAPILWKSNVSLIGKGIGKTKIIPYGTGFSAIDYDRNWASLTNTFNDCTFMDFEIDGSNLGNGTYNVGEKGIFIQFMKRPNFINVFIHDTPATGFGTDFLQDATFENCHAVNCGRTWSTGQVGGAGFGIGTGAWAVENVSFNNCVADQCGNYGFFVERQSAPYNLNSKGSRITDCIATNGKNVGICDKGVDELKVKGCTMEGNAVYGFQTSDNPIGGIIEGNTIRGNGVHGVYIGSSTQGYYTLRNNKIYGNVKHGIVQTGVPNNLLIGNEIYNNGGVGIDIAGTVTDIRIEDNEIYNNGTGAFVGYAQGIILEANITRPRINNNKIYDKQATQTQTVGIQLSGGMTITDGTIENNDVKYNKTTGISINGTLSGTLINRNRGYNPVSVTSVTPIGTPWVYTPPTTDTVIFLQGTGINVSIANVQVLTGVTQASIPIKAGQSASITYTSITSAIAYTQ